MRIAYIAIKGIPMSGGIEKYTEEMANKLFDMGHEITIYTSKHYGNCTCKNEKYMIRAVPSLKGKYFEKISIALIASIDQLFRNYDIVHYHALGPSIFAFIPRLRGRKVVIQSHGIEHQRAKWGKIASLGLKLLEKASYNMGNSLTVVSKQLQLYFKNTYNKDSVFIPTGIELPNLDEYDDEILKEFNLNKNGYYLFISRIVLEKGLHYLIEAYKKLKTNKKLVIAGKLEKTDEYHKSLIEMAKNDKRIIFVGEVLGKQKDMLFKGAYAFCLPSEIEGMSIALLEAMSYRKVCIVSDIKENLDVAQGHSYIFNNKNIESLYCALHKVENECSEELDSCAYKAQKYVIDNHQFIMIAKKMEKLYKSL